MTERVNTNTDFAEKSIYLAMKENEEWKNDTRKEEEEDYKKEPHILFPASEGIRFSQKSNWRSFVRVAILQPQEHVF